MEESVGPLCIFIENTITVVVITQYLDILPVNRYSCLFTDQFSIKMFSGSIIFSWLHTETKEILIAHFEETFVICDFLIGQHMVANLFLITRELSHLLPQMYPLSF